MEHQMDYIEDLIIARLTGNIMEKDNVFLEEMISTDTDVARLWHQHLAVHAQLTDDYDREKAWQKITTGIKHSSRPPKRKYWTVFAVAASVLALAGIAYFSQSPIPKAPLALSRKIPGITLSTGNETVTIDKNKTGAYATTTASFTNTNGELSYTAKDTSTTILNVPQGLDYKLTLSDNTKVWVNAATRLSFPLQFAGNTREVTLEGEAYFEVTKNKAKPFIVHTEGISVQVYGTSFNVKAYKGETAQASLVEGSVKATSNNQQLLLVPGKAARLENGVLSETSFDATTVLAWMKGYYYFENEPLSTISQTVYRWFGYRFSYTDPGIASIHFSGGLEKAQALDVFLSRISSSANLRYTVTDSGIRLEKK